MKTQGRHRYTVLICLLQGLLCAAPPAALNPPGQVICETLPGAMDVRDWQIRLRFMREGECSLPHFFNLAAKVLDGSGRAVPDVALRIERRDIQESKPRIETSNSKGRLQHMAVPLGKYEIFVVAKDIDLLLMKLDTDHGCNFKTDIYLKTWSIEQEVTFGHANIAHAAFKQALALIDQQQFLEALPLIEKALSLEREALAESEKNHRQIYARESLRQMEGIYAITLFDAGKVDEARKPELWKRAEAMLAEAATRDPSDERPLKCLLEIAEFKKDPAACLKIRMAIQALGDPWASDAFTDALAAFKARRYSKARAGLLKAVEQAPDGEEAYYLLGLTEDKLGHRSAACEALRKYLELAPEGAHAVRVQAFLRASARKRHSKKNPGGAL